MRKIKYYTFENYNEDNPRPMGLPCVELLAKFAFDPNTRTYAINAITLDTNTGKEKHYTNTSVSAAHILSVGYLECLMEDFARAVRKYYKNKREEEAPR